MKLAWTIVLGCFACSVNAATLSQWDFNSDDGNQATGTLVPAVGSGSLALVGGTTDLFTFGSPSDPAPVPLNSAWSVGTYPAQGTASGTAGFESFVSTAGFQDVSVGFSFRNQPSANKWFALQATGDHGGTWADVAVFDVAAADTWFTQSFAISPALAAADDNALFGFRVVAVFAPNTNAYAASAALYNPVFGLEYDVLTVTAQPVPEPATVLTLCAGLAALVLSAHARRLRGRRYC